MKHLGDITKISGYEAPIVDCIIGGSPCQDLSLAGKRAGLDGERSGLYMDQIRIVKEMRERDRNSGRTDRYVRPRYMVWENVPGAFSSNGGKDFAAVIEEIIKIAEPDADVHVCSPDKRWTKSGCYYADDGSWSLAWRLHDAQFWGVPQRRKRISLVADFGGLTAPEILFERQGLSRDTEPSGAQGEGVAAAVGNSAAGAISFQERAGCPGGGKGILIQNERIGALSTLNNQRVFYRKEPLPFDTTQITSPLNGNNPQYGDPCHPLAAEGHAPAIAHTLKAKANCDYREDSETYPITKNIVRRLTPLECERLQGFPDGWTDIGDWVDSKGKRHKAADSPRYKSLGNSIALPFWRWMLKRISAQYERAPTMASLFDGIGGFPYLWEGINGKGTAVWASEIEEFPMAVTKIRLGEG